MIVEAETKNTAIRSRRKAGEAEVETEINRFPDRERRRSLHLTDEQGPISLIAVGECVTSADDIVSDNADSLARPTLAQEIPVIRIGAKRQIAVSEMFVQDDLRRGLRGKQDANGITSLAFMPSGVAIVRGVVNIRITLRGGPGFRCGKFPSEASGIPSFGHRK